LGDTIGPTTPTPTPTPTPATSRSTSTSPTLGTRTRFFRLGMLDFCRGGLERSAATATLTAADFFFFLLFLSGDLDISYRPQLQMESSLL